MLSRKRTNSDSERRVLQATWDAGSWIAASVLAMEFRFDLQISAREFCIALVLGLAFAALQIMIGFGFHLYRGGYRFGSIDEVVGIGLTASINMVLVGCAVLIVQPDGLPRSVPLLAGVLALALMCTGRIALRLIRSNTQSSSKGLRTLIYGAGDMGEHLLRLMKADRHQTFNPVGFLDDDLRKQRLRTNGVRVVGTIDELESLVNAGHVQVLVVAITRVSRPQLHELRSRCIALGIELRVVPSAASIISSGFSLQDVNEVTVEDLLGRQPIAMNEPALGEFLADKRVLITGAGGSIGSELARQVARYAPESLILLDRDESAILETQMSINGNSLLNGDALVLGDIRDEEHMNLLFAKHRPQIVFHAAALKHLTLLERFPEEAYKTNVLGTLNVLHAAEHSGVETFVNISTDKAADPESILGLSKLATERIVAGMPSTSSKYLSVRFGNVLGSRGSVLQIFRSQIISGGPVTVTHPEVSRYFMTIPEAVHLVLQAARIGTSGTTLILDMGQPIKIATVAQQLIELSDRQVSIEYVGLRPGEKLHEILLGEHETANSTSHPQISQVVVAPIERSITKELISTAGSADTAIRCMSFIAGRLGAAPDSRYVET